jgi:hypothetical protein
MGKPNLARDPIECHDVMAALRKVRALASILEELTAPDDGNDLVHILDNLHPDGARSYLAEAIGKALSAGLDEAEEAFRKSLTTAQAYEQVTGVSRGEAK